MPVLGGFCPMPLRLDSGGLSGWSPEQHARAAADLDALVSTAPFLRIRLTKAASVITVLSYKDQLRSGIGVFLQVGTVVVHGTGDFSIRMPTRYVDDFEQDYPINFNHGLAFMEGETCTRATVDLAQNTVRIRGWQLPGPTAVDGTYNIRLWT